MKLRIFTLALLALPLLGMPWGTAASAHVFAPSLLELKQTDTDRFDVRWKQPELLPTGAQAAPLFPAVCEAVGDKSLRREETGIAVLWTVRCRGGLEGMIVGVEGLGFAGALTEAGLPQTDVPAALFAFNVGIELGQLAFVAVVLAASAALSRVASAVSWNWSPWLALAPIYLIGCASAFWVVERIVGVV